MTQNGDVSAAVLTVVGDVDTASAGRISAHATELLDTDDLQRLVVDLGQVSFMDSTGVGLLIQIRSACVRRGIDLVLSDVPRGTRVLLEISGLSDAFRLRDTPP
ncbi:MAG TPA: STAS domain-containing protein [Jatrophihabitans sp.]|jgi:anti-anti-sigma factor